MAALLKDVYDTTYITHIATTILDAYPDFKQQVFIDAVFDEAWPSKELKARTEHIAHQFNVFIPLEYQQVLVILQDIAEHFTGYEGMFVPAYVELYGLNELTPSIDALAYITQFASAEFAVRPFIEKYPEAMQKISLDWAASDNEHIRRLASEGCRPRLPWAMALPAFKKDPAFILPILEALKTDNSEYVRRSVANNLNDIAKDHPQLVVEIATSWLSQSDTVATKRLVKHACRTLLKQAHPDALALFGFLPPDNIEVIDFKVDKQVKLGERLDFSFTLKHLQSAPLAKLRIEFAIDFMKKNGQQARKIFQISEAIITADNKSINKSFSFKKISTRQYYCGQHSLAILVNGRQLFDADFILSV